MISKRRWYRSRTIQAAMIGGIFVLAAALLPQIRFWRDSGSNAKHDRSTSKLHSIATLLEPKVNSENYHTILPALREKLGLRPVQPLETGKRIEEAAAGTYFFVSPVYLSVRNKNLKELLGSPGVSSKWYDTSFEMHYTSREQLALLAYVNVQTAAELTSSSRTTASVTAVLSPSPWNEFTNLVSIPIARFVSIEWRNVDRPGYRFFFVLDARLE